MMYMINFNMKKKKRKRMMTFLDERESFDAHFFIMSKYLSCKHVYKRGICKGNVGIFLLFTRNSSNGYLEFFFSLTSVIDIKLYSTRRKNQVFVIVLCICKYDLWVAHA
jgi:hypothetical protein